MIAIQYNLNNDNNKITHLSNYEPHKTLGVLKSPTGYDQSGAKVLDKKNSTHEKNIMNSPFDQQDTWML